MKFFAGGPQDIEDARRVLELAGSSLDNALLQQIVEKYGDSAVQALKNLR